MSLKHTNWQSKLMTNSTTLPVKIEGIQKLSRICVDAIQRFEKLSRSCPEAVWKLSRSCLEAVSIFEKLSQLSKLRSCPEAV